MRPLIPALLLAVVAAAQIALTKTAALTPWKGGGFGMFSTLDHSAFRTISIVVEGPDRSETIETPAALNVIAARAVALPADWLLRDLAEGVIARERRNGRPVTRVQLEVRGTTFDRVTLQAHEHTLRRLVYGTR